MTKYKKGNWKRKPMKLAHHIFLQQNYYITYDKTQNLIQQFLSLLSSLIVSW